MKVFKRYNMTSLITQKKDIIVANILVSKVHKRNKTGENTTLSSRKSLSKSTELSDESILSANEKENVHFASDESIWSSNEESNVRPIDDKDISLFILLVSIN